jgi:hypothetical protein
MRETRLICWLKKAPPWDVFKFLISIIHKGIEGVWKLQVQLFYSKLLWELNRVKKQ